MAVDVGPGNVHAGAATPVQHRPGAGADPVAGDRPLTAEESAHLDRLRHDLAASGVDVHDPHALGALSDSSWEAWAQSGGAGDPRPLVRALGVGLGDVLATSTGASWMLRTTDGVATPVVMTSTWCVAPLEEVSVRWRAGERGWAYGWVERTIAHLTGTRSRHAGQQPQVPSPARSGEEQGAAHRPRTPDELPSHPSAAVQDLALRALAQAVEDVVPAGGPLAPFAMVDDGTQVGIRRFTEPGLARGWVRATGALRAAIAWQGRLNEPADPRDGNGRDAVFVEACDSGRPGFVVAHRYASVPGVSRIVGTPEIVGTCEPLL
ncbi:hypothetical protein ACTHAM_000880 [Cellulomonas soli]|uniref:hypothetical protein n=1 Tax=Cellulomonas soli TaxID=931535 RepID=UPI003F8299A3